MAGPETALKRLQRRLPSGDRDRPDAVGREVVTIGVPDASLRLRSPPKKAVVTVTNRAKETMKLLGRMEFAEKPASAVVPETVARVGAAL